MKLLAEQRYQCYDSSLNWRLPNVTAHCVDGLEVGEFRVNEAPCQIVNYLYLRVGIARSIEWQLDCCRYIIPEHVNHIAGYISDDQQDGRISIVFAVPCTSNGMIEDVIREEYEDLADAKFVSLHPEMQLI